MICFARPHTALPGRDDLRCAREFCAHRPGRHPIHLGRQELDEWTPGALAALAGDTPFQESVAKPRHRSQPPPPPPTPPPPANPPPPSPPPPPLPPPPPPP